MSESPQTPDSGQAELIELALIDEPAHAMRETMDEMALAALAESIAQVGLIQPLIVEQHSGRYRVIAGHRRLIACQIVGLRVVPAIVRAPGAIDAAAITFAENYHREAVNPVEEAAFFQRQLDERFHNDIELLAAAIKHPVSFVDDRLLLLRGDAGVLEALRTSQISLAVARELNRVRELGTLTWLLDAAIRGGATAAVVRRWREQYATGATAEQIAAGSPTPAAPDAAAIAAATIHCGFCSDTDNPHMMVNVWLHSYCLKVLRQAIPTFGDPPNTGA